MEHVESERALSSHHSTHPGTRAVEERTGWPRRSSTHAADLGATTGRISGSNRTASRKGQALKGMLVGSWRSGRIESDPVGSEEISDVIRNLTSI